MNTATPITPGPLLRDGFKATFANLLPFLIIALICHLPVIYWEYSQIDEMLNATDPSAYMSANMTEIMLRAMASMLCILISQAAMVYGTVQFFSGNSSTMGECLAKGFSKLIPALGVAVVGGVIMFAGFLCFIIPGIILFCALYVAVPAAVMENRGVGASITRSFELTKGARMAIFITIFFMFMLTFIVTFILEIFVPEGIPTWMLSKGIGLFFGTVGSVISAVTYLHLVKRKEGVDVMELSKIFD